VSTYNNKNPIDAMSIGFYFFSIRQFVSSIAKICVGLNLDYELPLAISFKKLNQTFLKTSFSAFSYSLIISYILMIGNSAFTALFTVYIVPPFFPE